tara:strand:+ start:893 stop:1048 length:156 start_codon:yes stop_codon:yes gene_type:complete
MSYGAIYCESWWGDNDRSEGWGAVYPDCGGATTIDSTTLKVDSTTTTIDTT